MDENTKVFGTDNLFIIDVSIHEILSHYLKLMRFVQQASIVSRIACSLQISETD